VRESTVAPKIAVPDAEMKSKDIKVGNGGTQRTNRPNSLWNARRVETGSNTKSSDGM